MIRDSALKTILPPLTFWGRRIVNCALHITTAICVAGRKQASVINAITGRRMEYMYKQDIEAIVCIAGIIIISGYYAYDYFRDCNKRKRRKKK